MYVRIADELRDRIADGALPVGAELPSTSRLIEEFNVSVTVVRAAVRELRNEGLVVGQPGKAVYVQHVPESREASADFSAVMQQLQVLREHVEALDSRLERLEKLARPESS